jgi:hypothetical protein
MSYIIELYYKAPPDHRKESDLVSRIAKLGGRLDDREEPEAGGPQNVCLTFEFDTIARAESAAEQLRHEGEYVEGPAEYASD